MISRQSLSALLLVTLSTLAGASRAQEPPAAAAPEESPTPATQESESQEPRVVLHGYLTQAYAQSDGETIIGIPEKGTTDYRRAALLVRGRISDKDHLVLQIAHRRLGEDLSMGLEPDLRLDWAFYEHRFGNGLALRAGRMPNPIGLYSENRYVGTLLPFYRAPYNFYQEGTYTSETIDGVGLWHTLFGAKKFPLDIRLVAGGFDQMEFTGPKIYETRTNNAVGGQLWMNTPVNGLRFGVGAEHYTLRNSPVGGPTTGTFGDSPRRSYTASFDGSREHFRLRSEFRETFVKPGPDQPKTLDPLSILRSFYVYAGATPLDRLWLHLQFDTSSLEIPLRAAGGSTLGKWDDYYTDWTAGVSFAFRPEVVVKGEYHWTKNWIAYGKEDLRRFGAAPYDTQYLILSLSASF